MNFKHLLPTFKFEKTIPVPFEKRFTVFTPVYNGEKTIKRVYQSLKAQTMKDFEWLIINDGSTDHSHAVILSIIKDSTIKINYVNNETNRHKMACFIQAIEIANGEFLLTFDADDECVPDALEIFEKEYLKIPEVKRPSIAALTGLCIDQYGSKIGNDFPIDPFFSTPFELTAVAKIKGEKWGFTKTAILRNIDYPKSFLNNNGCIPESLIWNLIGYQGYQTKYFNKTLRIYHKDRDESISSGSLDKNALGSATNYIANFNWFFRSYFFKTPVYFLKNLYFLLRVSNYLNFNLKNYITSIESVTIKFLFVLLWPFRRFFKY